jgi:hypothetical protein
MKGWSAKMLQLVGLLIVLSGLLIGIQQSLIRFELTAFVLGTAIFYAGRFLEKKIG